MEATPPAEYYRVSIGLKSFGAGRYVVSRAEIPFSEGEEISISNGENPARQEATGLAFSVMTKVVKFPVLFGISSTSSRNSRGSLANKDGLLDWNPLQLRRWTPSRLDSISPQGFCSSRRLLRWHPTIGIQSLGSQSRRVFPRNQIPLGKNVRWFTFKLADISVELGVGVYSASLGTNAVWIPVGNVNGNDAVLPLTEDHQFYRLRRPLAVFKARGQADQADHELNWIEKTEAQDFILQAPDLLPNGNTPSSHSTVPLSPRSRGWGSLLHQLHRPGPKAWISIFFGSQTELVQNRRVKVAAVVRGLHGLVTDLIRGA